MRFIWKYNQRKMAATYKQDMAPKGGYPEIKYARNLPKRGPPGWAIFLGGISVMSFGFAVAARANQRRRYVKGFRCSGVDEITVYVYVFLSEYFSKSHSVLC